MRQTRKRSAAFLLAVLLILSLFSGTVTARADTITVDGRTFQDGLGSRADLAGAKSALTDAVRNWSLSVDLTRYGLGTEQLAQVYDQVFFENPGFFYLENGYSYTTRQTRENPGALVVSVVEPKYYGEFTVQDVPAYEAAVKNALSVLRPGMTDFDKALALHDYLAENCGYDDTLTHYSPYHALIHRTAVCQGYLLAYSDLLGRAGVKNYPAVSTSQNHGWNTVRLDGNWYHVDVTWDHANELPEGWVLHTNFLRSDQGIQSTGSLHRDWAAPNACTDTTYEDSFLPSLRDPVLYPPEGGAYFLLDGRLCCSTDLSSLQYEVVSEAGTGEAEDPRTGMVYSPRDARLAYFDGSIYYTDSVHLYRYELASGETSLHGTYSYGGGFLYGLSVIGTDGDGSHASLVMEVRAYPGGPFQSTYTLKPTLSPATAHRIVCPSRGYRDVSADQWYHEAVDYVLENGLMNGVSLDAFAPGGTTTRAMIVTVLYRMETDPSAGSDAAFSDVAEGSWYAEAVNWAASSGIISGVTDTAFSPDTPITREQFAAILFRYAEYRGLDTGTGEPLSGYEDVSRISGYAEQAMAWAGAAGLMTGRTETALAPAGTATRAETATILMRLAELLSQAR